MRKRMGIFFLCLMFILLGIGCARESVEDTEVVGDTEVEVSEEERATEVQQLLQTSGPWDGNLYLAIGEDSLTFEKQGLLLEHAGVPNLLRTSSGQLILTYQYFSYDDVSMFDIIAYSISEDDGKTWTEPAKVNFVNLPQPQSKFLVPVDPTLVELEDGSLRFYFTYHSADDPYARMGSAQGEDITGPFNYEEGVRMADDNQHLLDPAVIFFDGLWHHYKQGSVEPTGEYGNFHSTSEDGLDFTRQESIDLKMMMLGNPILVDDGIRFYGGENQNVVSAFSLDGFHWEMDEGVRVSSAGDPAVVELLDGTYLMIYTGFET